MNDKVQGEKTVTSPDDVESSPISAEPEEDEGFKKITFELSAKQKKFLKKKASSHTSRSVSGVLREMVDAAMTSNSAVAV